MNKQSSKLKGGGGIGIRRLPGKWLFTNRLACHEYNLHKRRSCKRYALLIILHCKEKISSSSGRLGRGLCMTIWASSMSSFSKTNPFLLGKGSGLGLAGHIIRRRSIEPEMPLTKSSDSNPFPLMVLYLAKHCPDTKKLGTGCYLREANEQTT